MQNLAKISARKVHSIELILSEYALVLKVYTFFHSRLWCDACFKDGISGLQRSRCQHDSSKKI